MRDNFKAYRKSLLPMATIMRLDYGRKISRRHAIAAVRSCAEFCETMAARGASDVAGMYARDAMRIAQAVSA